MYGKGAKTRELPVPPEVADALRDIVRPMMLAAGVPPLSRTHMCCATPTGRCSWSAPTRGESSCKS